ncbi:ribosomal L1 domain-containing protein 1 [Ricinus communis]|uniref:ribosomal L1 domain-containing protein 1 n=1 Tax=Ricinus communis TaxID=3988 RepID=UPI00201AD525|nr:ribosomal L1 domain-containing protein 1 [Ricinus communis]
MATITPSSGVSPKTVEKAVNSLLKWKATKSETQKPQLLEHDEFVYLILTLKKIPQKGSFSRTNPHKISLPNPLINPQNDNTELCLIIDDRPKSGLTKDAAKKKIQNDNIPISKIIKISKLKSDYRPFEAKRKLCDSYDMFFADKRVVPLLPKMLGKQFFKKKKIPVGVDLKHKNWKEQIEKACGSGLLFMRSGTCSVVKIGRVSMGGEELVKNVMAAINGIAEIVPRKWGGIRSFHLKLLESLALPIYQALPDFKLKIEGVKEEEEKEEKVEGTNVKEEKKVGKKKGRIHEIRYMDNTASEDDDEVLLDKGEGDVDNDDGDSEVIMGTDGLEGKKRKKGDVGKVEKKLKKTKLKKEDGVKGKKKLDNMKNEDSLKKKKSKKAA